MRRPTLAERRRPRSRGRALRRLAVLLLLAGCALPRWPVQGTLTSPFGLRFRGFRPEIHRGVDIATAPGTPVRAMAAGRVAFAGTLRGYGLVVILDHGRRLRTLYAHLGEIHVRDGDAVTAGEVIGSSGASGRATAPHLHFEIQRRGRPVDPVPLLGGPPAVPASGPGSGPPAVRSIPRQDNY